MLRNEVKKESDGFIEYIDRCHTPYHSVAYFSEILEKAGAYRLYEEDEWEIEPDRIYYTVRNGTLLSVFRISSDNMPLSGGFRIAAAHHDAPGFRVKPAVSTIDGGYERLTLEPYGGLIHHVWLDRPLSCAGRLYYNCEGGMDHVDFDLQKPVAVIPSAAIHMVGDVNDNAKFDLQTEIRPFVGQPEEGCTEFLHYVADSAGVDVEDILSFDMMMYDASPAEYIGINDEFISSPGLDDCEMAYSVISAIVSDELNDFSFAAFIYDHEECGSTSDRGAQGSAFVDITERICSKLGYNKEDYYRIMAKSIVFSADMAHASHPSYMQKSDPDTIVSLNKGPVLKTNANQSYANSVAGSAFFKKLCKENGIPYQEYVNRSTVRGGRTIGPMLSAMGGVVTVDIGNPMLAMHSVREMGGAKDIYYMRKLLSAFL